MGVLTYVNKNLKIKTQFLLFFFLSFIVSVILSICLLGFLMFSFDNKKKAYIIENYAVLNIDKIFNSDFQVELNKQIPNEGFEYWVVSKEKDILYSSGNKDSLPENVKISSRTYYMKEYNNNKIYGVSFKPLFDGEIYKGGIVLRYTSNAFVEMNVINSLIRKTNYDFFFIFFIILPTFILCPFSIVFIFSIIFSKGINRPLKEMIDVSNQIRNGRLDVTINTSYNNELGQVLKSFEDMRGALQSSLKRQWIMEEQRKEMILSLTHDIKTPITIICGHLELLSGSYTKLSKDQKETCMKTLLNNAERVRVMIHELNEIWDLERPNFTLNIQNINLEEYISDIKGNFSYICAEKNVGFYIFSSFNNEESFAFDRFRMNEVLENILSNSLKYIENDGEIWLEAYWESSNLLFKMSDNGKGFTEEVSLIFNKYYKGNEDCIYKYSSGLGLYICQLIVERHNGKITAYNNIKGGATIEISLPLKHSGDTT
ncbi:HAMP domain-containing sensor histidine kinase [Bacillus cereus group sp. BfR-BA-01331]|uniref:HAMP domain-containing sensor histidine kinase n=1 Tax=Bacillus cereus group sp. BfR-BA-01331 TaxID=2920307 RepID=UPI001F586960|nr:HAMP domain-containing sensor histidine kinase [Bacillus cereus group sp. BfR-BA-01331]